MPPENNDEESNVSWFNVVEQEPLDEDIDLENYELDYPEVAFEESIEAIQADALAPQDLLGFSNITRKQIHDLRTVWGSLDVEHRVTIAEVALMVAREHPYADFGRFFQVLLDDREDDVRLNASTGAGLSEVTTLIKPLTEIAENDANQDVREAAIDSLAAQVVALDLGVVANKQDIQSLMLLKRWAQDESWSPVLRAAALQSYSHNTADDDVGAMIEAFVASDDEVLQIGAMRAMIEYGAGHFTRFLERQLRNQDVDAREAAALAMGQSTDGAVVPMLTMAARTDAEPTVREAAYTALGNNGSRAAVNALVQLRENASDDEIEVIDASIQYANELQDLEELDELGMFEFADETEDDQ